MIKQKNVIINYIFTHVGELMTEKTKNNLFDVKQYSPLFNYIDIKNIRILYVLFAFLYGFFGITDVLFYPDSWVIFIVLRFAVVIPLFLLTIVLSYRKDFLNFYYPLATLNLMVGGMVIALMLIIAPENIIYYGGLFMVYFSGYLLLSLPFKYATLGGWTIFIFHFLGTVIVNESLPETYLYGSLFFVGANLIGMAGAKTKEDLTWKQHYKEQEIVTANAKLETSFREKVEQYTELETFIKENKDLKDRFEEKERLTQKLEETEQLFEQLAVQAKTFFYEVNKEGLYTYVSESVKDVLGYEPSELVSKKYFFDLFPENISSEYKDTGLTSLNNQQELSDFVNPIMKKDGTIIWVNTYVVPIIDEKNNTVSFQGSDTDITEKKEAEDSLNVFKAMTEQAEYGAALADLDGYLVYVNDSFCKMYGYKEEELIGKHISYLHTDDQLKTVLPLVESIKEKSGFASVEVWHKRKDRTVFPTIMTARLIITNEQPQYLSATVLDISSLKEVQNELLETETRYKTVSELSNTGVWQHFIDDNYLWCSKEYFAMLGYNYEDFPNKPNNINKNWVDLIHPEDVDRARKRFTQYLNEKPNKLYENHFRLKNSEGDYQWIWSRGNFIRDEDGSPKNIVIGTHIDVTDQKVKETEIEYLSEHDYLTHLRNRHYFEKSIQNLDEENDFPLGIVLFDINGLKIINDAFGHKAGDDALVMIANVLKKHVKKDDILARLGGDEFALLTYQAEEQVIRVFMSRVRKELETFKIQDIQLSLSMGMKIFDDLEGRRNNLLKEVENDLYKNKALDSHSSRNDAIASILQTLQSKYQDEKVHSERVSRYCKLIGKALNLSDVEVRELEMAGMYHDIGKIAIPDAILGKPARLTESEWLIMKEHSLHGYNILRAADKYTSLAEFALTHHERIDGTGYPKGLKGNDIPLFSRIISVADAYEAMTSDRPYRKAMKPNLAVEELKKYAGSQFDKEIVEIFIHQVLDIS